MILIWLVLAVQCLLNVLNAFLPEYKQQLLYPLMNQFCWSPLEIAGLWVGLLFGREGKL